MEKFFIPKDETEFVKWLMQTCIKNGWTIVVEYSEDETLRFITEVTTEVSLPVTAKNEYDSFCKLKAFVNPLLADSLISKLIRKCHVLSVHNEKEMIFLIADDFDMECFSCTIKFYNHYYQTLSAQNLIETG